MNEELPYLLVAGVCTASLLAWGYVLRQRLHSKAAVLPQAAEPPSIPFAAFGLALLCLAFLLLGPILDLAASFLDRPPPERPAPTLLDVQFNFAFDVLLAGALLTSIVAMGVPLSRAGFRIEGLGQLARDVILGFHLAIGPVFLVLIASEVLRIRGEEPEHEMLQMLAADGSIVNWVWISLTAVVAAPLAEEMLFRVLFQGWLERWVPALAAIGLSSALFCAVHRFPDSLALLPLALVLGYVQHRRQSYLTVVAIHAVFNAFNLLLTAVSGGRF